MSASEDINVIIGIATFKRPEGLRRLLESIAQTKASFIPHILVADNEGKGAGSAVVEEMLRAGYPFSMTITAVPERGISQARNALLQEGFGTLKADYLAMVDDDERVEAEWIAELVGMQKNTGADVVWGWVLPEFEEEPPSWTEGQTVFYRPKYPDGELNVLCGTTSVVFARSAWQNKNKKGERMLYFDCDFSLSGGSDTELFERLRQRGGRFAYTTKAVSHEFYPASRVTRKWALKRSFRIGTTHMRVLKLRCSFRNYKKWIIELAKLPVGAGCGFLQVLLGCGSDRLRMKGLLLISKQAGKFAGLFSYQGNEYKITHGQ